MKLLGEIGVEAVQRHEHTADCVLWEVRTPLEETVELDVHESVHRDTIMEVTNKMQLYRLIYYTSRQLHG